jgi:hypothetical protein
MGGGGGQQQSSTIPPPPTPAIKIDPATSGAEAALAGAAKDSYAARTETDEQKAEREKKGQPATTLATPAIQTEGRRRAPRTPASTMSAAQNLGQSAVLTG